MLTLNTETGYRCKTVVATILVLMGKVNEMNCVPRINYLLHSLPLEIQNSYFKRFDSLFKTFLWNGKRARMNMKKLQRPVNSCGLGFPNLLYYYYAFSLRHLAHWALDYRLD